MVLNEIAPKDKLSIVSGSIFPEPKRIVNSKSGVNVEKWVIRSRYRYYGAYGAPPSVVTI